MGFCFSVIATSASSSNCFLKRHSSPLSATIRLRPATAYRTELYLHSLNVPAGRMAYLRTARMLVSKGCVSSHHWGRLRLQTALVAQ
ncbi:hypothetical protein NXC24_PA00139 (plasmid) [Rhizobium sp. NXC24]|nr:hypothetical protein NXC24_PA00139 [Rhizobium sp. NXC24]